MDEQPGKRYQARWTDTQTAALMAFIRQHEARSMATHRKLPSTNRLARSALAQLVPGVLGPRSRLALRNMIRQLRLEAGSDRALFDYSKWTPEMDQALEGFIRRQLKDAAEGPVLDVELIQRAMAELVPLAVGPQQSLRKRIRLILSSKGNSVEEGADADEDGDGQEEEE